MHRRDFLATAGVAAVSPLPTLEALGQSAQREYIELRRYPGAILLRRNVDLNHGSDPRSHVTDAVDR